MPLSPVAYFGLLDDSNPRGEDLRVISDDQHRNILSSMKQQCPNWTGQVTATHADVNTLSGSVAGGVKPMLGAPGVTVLYSYNNATPPLGWTLEEPDTNLRELVIGQAAGGGTIGGTDDPTNMTQSVNVDLPAETGGTILNSLQVGQHTHNALITQFGDHNHRVNLSNNPGTSDQALCRGDGTFTPNVGIIQTDGNHTHSIDIQVNSGTDPHTHPLSGTASGSITFTPRYARGILMKLAV